MADRFHVKTLTLENFRCFEKAELGPFDPHFNLLVGENGSGKSSVLVALADLFFRIGYVNPNSLGTRLISDNDIRLTYLPLENALRTTRKAPFARLNASAEFDSIEVLAEDYMNWPPPNYGRLFPRIMDASTLFELSPGFDTKGLAVEGPAPLVLFYTTNRSFGGRNSRGNIQLPDSRLRETAFENWSSASISADSLRDWFKTQTLAALQHELRGRSSVVQTRNSSAQLHLLQLVSGAVVGAVEGSRSVEFDGERADLVVYFADGRREEFLQMSDGQRALVGLIADIARRACILNAAFLGNRALEETPGLVLIDEIDLHLHPRWQRQIVGALKRIFPNIQFFATTHSPQVIGQAMPEELVVLSKDGKQKHPSRSFGMDSNWVLECVMDAEGRDPATGAKIKEMFAALNDSDFDLARRRLSELRATIGEAPDVIAADAYLWNLGVNADEAAE